LFDRKIFASQVAEQLKLARGILAFDVIDDVAGVLRDLFIIRFGETIETVGIIFGHREELLFHKADGFGIVIAEEPDQGLCVGNHYW
jgi:hypothetical protein